MRANGQMPDFFVKSTLNFVLRNFNKLGPWDSYRKLNSFLKHLKMHSNHFNSRKDWNS